MNTFSIPFSHWRFSLPLQQSPTYEGKRPVVLLQAKFSSKGRSVMYKTNSLINSFEH